MSVTVDLKQYVLRTLLVISLSEEGKATNRYTLCKNKFLDLLETVSKQNGEAHLFERIKFLLQAEDEKDLKIRFYNCLIISDLVRFFFIGKLETVLDNDDKNRLTVDTTDIDGNPISYNVNPNSFEGEPIKSKVRFLMDQLLRISHSPNENEDNAEKEKNTAWLLLSLSSYNIP